MDTNTWAGLLVLSVLSAYTLGLLGWLRFKARRVFLANLLPRFCECGCGKQFTLWRLYWYDPEYWGWTGKEGREP